MQKAVAQAFGSDRDQLRAVQRWLSMQGPFWDDERRHSAEDYFECEGDVVTDTAVGEVAHRCHRGDDHHLVSFPSPKWKDPLITVLWHDEHEQVENIEVRNYWRRESVEKALEAAPAQFKSWRQIGKDAERRFANLRFSEDCFTPLNGHPFSAGVAQRITERLYVLDQHQSGLDEHGQRTPEAERLRQQHFVGRKARFSDSSDTEKHEFRDELTFQHPDQLDGQLFCPWHGKVNTPPIRIHFSWPAKRGQLYVVYVGPKLTKR